MMDQHTLNSNSASNDESNLSVEQSNLVQMCSWESVEPAALRKPGEITHAFHQLELHDLREAARFIQSLKYARNTCPENPLAVLDERRGTCSTKHALMLRLANEQGISMELTIGIYEMSEKNTPGVGIVLERFGLHSLPEAHCYLRMRGTRIDLTDLSKTPESEPITHFLVEEDIQSDQITAYKVTLHNNFLESWKHRQKRCRYSLQELWSIREQCILALSGKRL